MPSVRPTREHYDHFIYRPGIGGGARVKFDDPVPVYARILLPIVQGLNARIGIMAGCFLFCTRAAFDSAGGFDERVYAAEEAFISRALGRLGRLAILKQSVVTSGRKLRAYSAGEILSGMLKLAVRGTKGVRNRQHLDLWYGPRREDPKRSA
jgi:GT2 family glycosyltransferase